MRRMANIMRNCTLGLMTICVADIVKYRHTHLVCEIIDFALERNYLHDMNLSHFAMNFQHVAVTMLAITKEA